jgi:hypothetical protein
MIARERADCNETERIDKKNWSNTVKKLVRLGL